MSDSVDLYDKIIKFYYEQDRKPVLLSVLDAERWLEVWSLFGGEGALALCRFSDGTEPFDAGVELIDQWEYAEIKMAKNALVLWGLLDVNATEPTGWVHNPQTGRRRPGGDPAKEYVK